jgi:Mg2+ and Co2+ transporter CorA
LYYLLRLIPNAMKMLQVVSKGASETIVQQARIYVQTMTDQANAGIQQARALEQTVKEQGVVARAQAKMHAETMSLFTVVTTTFLPLSFLSSVSFSALLTSLDN